jgi:hypothetical protein
MNMSEHELEPQSRPPPTDGGSTVADKDEGLLQRELAHTKVNITPANGIAVSKDSHGFNVPALMSRTMFLFITTKSIPSAVNLLQWKWSRIFIIQKVGTLELRVYGQTRGKSGEDIGQRLNQLEADVAQLVPAFESAQRQVSEELNEDIDKSLQSWQQLRQKGAAIPICPRGLDKDTTLVFICFFYASLCAVLGRLPARSGQLRANVDKAAATWEKCGFPPVELPKFSLFPDAPGEITEQLPVLWIRTRYLTNKLYPGMGLPLIPRSLNELATHIQQLESHGRLNIVCQPLKTWQELPNRLHQIEKKLGDVKSIQKKLEPHEYQSHCEEARIMRLKDKLKTLEYLMPRMLPLPKGVVLADGDVTVYATDILAAVSIELDACPRCETGILEYADYIISLLGSKLDTRKLDLKDQDTIEILVRIPGADDTV